MLGSFFSVSSGIVYNLISVLITANDKQMFRFLIKVSGYLS